MRRRVAADLLARYIDGHLLGEGAAPPAVEAELAEIEALLPVVHRLRDVLVPVEPSAAFAVDLQGQLLAAWREEERRRLLREERRSLILRAAAVGSGLSIIALLAWAMRGRWLPLPGRVS